MNIETPKANIKGKVKSIFLSNHLGDTIYKYYYHYDSITGDLVSINNDSLVLYHIYKLDNNNMLFYNNVEGNTYKVNHIGKQIVSIFNQNSVVTQLFFRNNIVDSIYDTGNYFSYNINYYNFQYGDANCNSYSVNYIFNFTGTPEFKQYNVRLSYTNILNDNQCPAQKVGSLISFPDGLNNFNFISYFLGLNGYYILKPNKYLIDSVNTNDGNSYIKYDYRIENNLIMQQKTSTTIGGQLIYDLTYF